MYVAFGAAKALFFLHPGGSIAKYYAECACHSQDLELTPALYFIVLLCQQQVVQAAFAFPCRQLRQ